MRLTKTNFPWLFLWNFLLLALAVICMVSQAVHQRWPGAAAFAFIVYILVRLIYIENR